MMFNVDTLSLGFNLEDIKYQNIGNYFSSVRNYISYIDKMFKIKLYRDSVNKAKLEKLRKQRNNRFPSFAEDCIFRFNGNDGYSYCYNEIYKSLTVTLQHYNVETYTATEIIENTKNKIIQYFNLDITELPELELRRIDYYCNYRYRDEQEYKGIKYLIKIASDKFYTYSKETTDDAKKYVVKYLGRKHKKTKLKSLGLQITDITEINKEAIFNELDKSDLPTSRNLEVCIYDKWKEIQEKFEKGKATEEELQYYKNVIRIEVKVKNAKLNSNKFQDKKNSKSTIRTKDLENYYNEEAHNFFYSRTAAILFSTENFYRIDIALEKIQKADELKNNMKLKLSTLLKLIHTEGYSKAKVIWIDKYSNSTFKSQIKKIRELGINPLTYADEIDDIKIHYENIPNFSLVKNSEKELLGAMNKTEQQ